MKKITQVIHVTKDESMEFYFYRLKDIAYVWVVIWKKDRGENIAPMSWQVFQDVFLDRFFLCELREKNIEEFINLRQVLMTVKEYYLKFNHLSKYAPELITDTRSSKSKFVIGVSGLVVKEYRTAMLIGDMDLGILMDHAQ